MPPKCSMVAAIMLETSSGRLRSVGTAKPVATRVVDEAGGLVDGAGKPKSPFVGRPRRAGHCGAPLTKGDGKSPAHAAAGPGHQDDGVLHSNPDVMAAG